MTTVIVILFIVGFIYLSYRFVTKKGTVPSNNSNPGAGCCGGSGGGEGPPTPEQQA
jgi:hypothetical protein